MSSFSVVLHELCGGYHLHKFPSRFAETEGTAALAAILARYEVSVDAAKFPDIPGESIQVGVLTKRLVEPQLILRI